MVLLKGKLLLLLIYILFVYPIFTLNCQILSFSISLVVFPLNEIFCVL